MYLTMDKSGSWDTVIHGHHIYQLIGKKCNLRFSTVKISYRMHSGFDTTSRIYRIMYQYIIPVKRLIVQQSQPQIFCSKWIIISCINYHFHRPWYISYQFDYSVAIQLTVLNVFCLRQSFANLSLFHFQTKDGDAQWCSQSSNNGGRNQKMLGPFLL